jgi:spore coat protein U-like protein
MQARASRILVATSLAGACGLALGATKTATFAVSATVVSNCMVDLASTIVFGTYMPSTGTINQTSAIAVRCTSNTPYGIGLSVGTDAGSNFAQRKMSSATVAGSLQYNLYNTAARDRIWNNPGAPTATLRTQGGTGTGLANLINHAVYGRLQDSTTSQAAMPASNHTSTITVSVNY